MCIDRRVLDEMEVCEENKCALIVTLLDHHSVTVNSSFISLKIEAFAHLIKHEIREPRIVENQTNTRVHVGLTEEHSKHLFC